MHMSFYECLCTLIVILSGHLVSGYVKQHLPIILVNHLTTEKDVRKALTSGFVEVDKSLGNSRIDCEFSGSTAVVSYLKVNLFLLVARFYFCSLDHSLVVFGRGKL